MANKQTNFQKLKDAGLIDCDEKDLSGGQLDAINHLLSSEEADALIEAKKKLGPKFKGQTQWGQGGVKLHAILLE